MGRTSRSLKVVSEPFDFTEDDPEYELRDLFVMGNILYGAHSVASMMNVNKWNGMSRIICNANHKMRQCDSKRFFRNVVSNGSHRLAMAGFFISSHSPLGPDWGYTGILFV